MDEIHLGNRVRPSAVAGVFYPDEPGELGREVDRLLAAAAPPPAGLAPKGVIAPHAGYIYSGPLAGCAFRVLASRRAAIRRVVMFGPAHRVRLRGLALPDADAFRTPLGDVPIDAELGERALALPKVEQVALAHEREHSLEVMVPFLQRALGPITLAPFVVGDATAAEVGAVMDALWGGDETAIVVSSDLSHFLSYEDALARDAATADAIEALRDVDVEEACGARGIDGLLWVARRRGLSIRRIGLTNSGDMRGGRAEVVGYGAFSIEERERAS